MTRPIDTIESAQEYVTLLAEQVDEVRATIADDISAAMLEEAQRRIEGLQLADYKLQQLNAHLNGAKRMLNDLRLLRRVLALE